MLLRNQPVSEPFAISGYTILKFLKAFELHKPGMPFTQRLLIVWRMPEFSSLRLSYC
jgi:hypothetical protein